jgi:hypothetical protein
LISGAVWGVACGPGQAPAGVEQSPIVNGSEDPGHPAVVIIHNPGRFEFCSGTLIAAQAVLTAAHCVAPGEVQDPPAADVTIGDTGFVVQSTFRNPGYDEDARGVALRHDIALVILKEPAIGAATLPLTTAAPRLQQQVAIVGFGASQWSNGQGFGYAVKRLGLNSLTGVDALNMQVSGGPDAAAPCHGDSGGPWLGVRNDAREEVIGVESLVNDFDCHSFGQAARVDVDRQWILDHIPYLVTGAIGGEYNAIGGINSVLGRPLNDETPTNCGGGRYNTFEHGQITWSPHSGAHETHGAIHGEWGAVNYECGPLGFPTSDESPTRCGGGRYNRFDNGQISWSPHSGAHETHGMIHGEWGAIDYECGPLGFPTTDETPTRCGGGRYNRFDHGQISWSPHSGAHETHGSILGRWGQLDYECGPLGFPTSDETPTRCGGGRYNNFEGGEITYSPSAGTYETINGPIRAKWAELDYECGVLGFPRASQVTTGNIIRQQFQGGLVRYDAATGQTTLEAPCGGVVCGATCCTGGSWCGLGNRCCSGCSPGCPC